MSVLNDAALDQLFRTARTHNAWLDKPVTDEQLHEIYEVMKWGATSANSSPARIVFVKSKEAKEKLKPWLDAGNVDKTMSAPVTVIDRAWFRSEHQSFIPLPAQAQAVFTIHVQLQALADVAADPRRASALHDAVASMSPAVLDYRGLAPVRDALLAWLAQRR